MTWRGSGGYSLQVKQICSTDGAFAAGAYLKLLLALLHDVLLAGGEGLEVLLVALLLALHLILEATAVRSHLILHAAFLFILKC